MVEVLQKITLYDLLGYAVPGTILVGVIGVSFLSGEPDLEKYADYAGYICAAGILIGYVLGIAISEVTDIICKVLKKGKYFKKNDINIPDYTIIAENLEKAGAIRDKNSINSMDEATFYSGYMYNDIQVEAKYSRIHNYASAELICKNMAFVSFVSAIILGICSSDMKVCIILIGWGLSALFLRRWKRNLFRKEAYAIHWFVQKHRDEQS